MWQTLTALASAWQSLTPECRTELQHAVNVCTNMVPTTPGFPPLRAAWGWLLLGLGLGFFTSVLLDHLRSRRRPNDTTVSAPSWRDLILDKMAVVADNAEQEVLQYLADGGAQALEDLARHAGLTPLRLLAHVLSSCTAPQASAPQAMPHSAVTQQHQLASLHQPVPAPVLAQVQALQHQHAVAASHMQLHHRNIAQRHMEARMLYPVMALHPPPGLAPPPR